MELHNLFPIHSSSWSMNDPALHFHDLIPQVTIIHCQLHLGLHILLYMELTEQMGR